MKVWTDGRTNGLTDERTRWLQYSPLSTSGGITTKLHLEETMYIMLGKDQDGWHGMRTVSKRNFAKTHMKSVTILDKLRLQCETLIIKVCKVKFGHSGTFQEERYWKSQLQRPQVPKMDISCVVMKHILNESVRRGHDLQILHAGVRAAEIMVGDPFIRLEKDKCC